MVSEQYNGQREHTTVNEKMHCLHFAWRPKSHTTHWNPENSRTSVSCYLSSLVKYSSMPQHCKAGYDKDCQFKTSKQEWLQRRALLTESTCSGKGKKGALACWRLRYTQSISRRKVLTAMLEPCNPSAVALSHSPSSSTSVQVSVPSGWTSQTERSRGGEAS